MGFIASLIAFSFLIFFHELGHFLAARVFGVRVEVFSIGFGKKLLKKSINGTEYTISAIPLGGYVKMKGQDDANPLARSNDPDAYNSKPAWQRMIILVAGSGFNFILAFLLFVAVGNLGVQTLSPIVGNVKPNSPAQIAGILAGDKIVQIGAKPIKGWDEISPIIKNSNEALDLIVERDGTQKRLILTAQMDSAENIFGEVEQRKMIGISPKGEVVVISYGAIESISFAWQKTIQASTLIFQSIIKLTSGVIGIENVGGVISIVQFTAEATALGIVPLLMITALISVNLGVLNLLPIPALDGGHIMFVLYEQITGKIPSEKIFYNLTIAGWAVLLMLMLLGLYNDINRLAK